MSRRVIGQQANQSIKDQPPYFLSSDPDSDDLGVQQVHIANRGSKPQYADVLIENIPAQGVIDSGLQLWVETSSVT